MTSKMSDGRLCADASCAVLLPPDGGAFRRPVHDLPPGVFRGGKGELAEARAGTYTIDPDHTAVLARVSHIGYSWLVFRFDKASGKLTWDPARPRSRRSRSACETASITSNVKDFADQLAGEQYLEVGEVPRGDVRVDGVPSQRCRRTARSTASSR